ncbi:tRNA lysidine(34) synthetase TilS [Larkinella terrae]
MAELFRWAGFRYGIAHVNFQLRGTDSEEDQAFVKALAERHQVRFHTTQLAAKEEAEKLGISTQMAARQLRYAWFEDIAKEFGYNGIATAHHQDDVLETILLNLVRGTGLTGLRGIPIRQGNIIRPLWFSSRAEIEMHAQKTGLVWREDGSNSSDKYHRNRLRHQVVPVLKELNPSLLQTLQTTVTRLQSADNLVDEEIRCSWEEIAENRSNSFSLSIQKLITYREWEFRLAEWLQPFGFQYIQTKPIAAAVRSSVFGQKFYSTTHQIMRDRQYLVIEKRHSSINESIVVNTFPDQEVLISAHHVLGFTVVDKPADFQLSVDQQIAYLDADLIQWPLTIRQWQNGESFRPLGMKGSQTIGNFLTNRKVTLAERRFVQVLLSDNQVVWLIGHRISDQFKITAKTRKILKIERRHTSELNAG